MTLGLGPQYKMAKLLKYSILAVVMLLSIPVNCTMSKKPHIIFILVDDLGWDDVGFHGSEIRTPNIDKLASEGVILNNYYVQPICTPTRGALLTGKYPIHTGLQHYVIVASQPYGLPLKEKTLAQQLNSVGYESHMVGKWHLGFFKEAYLPQHRGFKSHFGYYLGVEDYFDHYSGDGGMLGYDLHSNGIAEWNFTEQYSTTFYKQKAVEIIKNHGADKPLFLYLPFQAAHAGNAPDPIQVPLKYADRFPHIKDHKRRMFAGVVSALDDAVGDIYQTLQQKGIANNSIIVFSTDNGGPANGYDGNAACNKPLRGIKNTLWQGGVRGVGFVHSPLLKKRGYVNEELMHVTDWFPTLLAASGVNVTTTAFSDLDGINQWDVISKDENTKRQEVLLNIDPIQKFEGLIVKNYKYIYGHIGNNDGWYNCNFPHKESLENTDGEYDRLLADYLAKDQRKNYFSNPEHFTPRATGQTDSFSESESSKLEELIDMIRSANPDTKRMSNTYSKSLFFESENKNPIETEDESAARKVIVKCGPKPKDSHAKCNPKKAPCLFDLEKDPCEYKNLAHQFPDLVKTFRKRVKEIKKTMVKPGNKPIDPKGNPQLHGGVWNPWM